MGKREVAQEVGVDAVGDAMTEFMDLGEEAGRKF